MSSVSPPASARAQERGEKFSAFMDRIARNLPFGLSRVVPGSLLGFAVINSFTFGVDITILTLLRSGLGWPLPAAITVGYVIAFGLAFFLNRAFNFRSHGPVGSQMGVYAVVVALNYVLWILGVGSGLAYLGVDYHVARLCAGACEAAYMYAAMRWVVFREPKKAPLTPES